MQKYKRYKFLVVSLVSVMAYITIEVLFRAFLGQMVKYGFPYFTLNGFSSLWMIGEAPIN